MLRWQLPATAVVAAIFQAEEDRATIQPADKNVRAPGWPEFGLDGCPGAVKVTSRERWLDTWSGWSCLAGGRKSAA